MPFDGEDDGQDDELGLQQTEEDDDYGDEGQTETDAYEIMHRAQGQAAGLQG